MNAIDYFKKYGLKGSREHLDWMVLVGARRDIHGCFMDDLKRIVESHDLVKSCGGLDSVGEKLTHGMYESRAVIDRLKQAILDVESCQ